MYLTKWTDAKGEQRSEAHRTQAAAMEQAEAKADAGPGRAEVLHKGIVIAEFT